MTTIAEEDDLADPSGSGARCARLPSPWTCRARAWVSAGLGLVIFFAGLACGASVVRMTTESRRATNWGDLLERAAKRLQQDLDLTEAQQERIKEIVKTHQPELDRIRTQTIREMRAELQQVIEETAAALTPEQASQFRPDAQSRLDQHFPAQYFPVQSETP